MKQAAVENCPTKESGLAKTGKIICGSCIMIAVAIPIVLVVLAVLAKIFGLV